jgi:hypothetical protein
VKSRLTSLSLLAIILLAGTVPVQASSVPVIRGQVSTLEVCEQASPCGAAVFVGFFAGQVGLNPFAFGTIVVSANHDSPLPLEGDFVKITGGDWSLRLLSGRRIAGVVEEEGSTLTNIGNDLFEVHVLMRIDEGGIGSLRFEGTLSHQTFPPNLTGRILQ